MNDPTKSVLKDGLIAEAIVNPDGSWTALDAEGKRIEFVDLDDFEIIEAVIRWRPPEESVR